MIDQIGLHADVAREHVREELLGESRFALEHAKHDRLFDTTMVQG